MWLWHSEVDGSILGLAFSLEVCCFLPLKVCVKWNKELSSPWGMNVSERSEMLNIWNCKGLYPENYYLVYDGWYVGADWQDQRVLESNTT